MPAGKGLRALHRYTAAKRRVESRYSNTQQAAFVQSQRKIGKALAIKAEGDSRVSVLKTKADLVDAKRKDAENSWPIIRQLRRWYWGWRAKRIYRKYKKANTKLDTNQRKKEVAEQKFKTQFQERKAKAEYQKDLAKAKLENALAHIIQHSNKMTRIVLAEVSTVDRENNAHGTPLTRADLDFVENKIREHGQNTDRDKAFRLLRLDEELLNMVGALRSGNNPEAIRIMGQLHANDFYSQRAP